MQGCNASLTCAACDARFLRRWRLQVGREEGRQDREQDQRDRDGDEEQQPPGEPRVELDARVGRGRTVAGHRGRAAGARGRMVRRRAGTRSGRARVAAGARRRFAAGCGAAAVGLRGPVNGRRATVVRDRVAERSSSPSTPAVVGRAFLENRFGRPPLSSRPARRVPVPRYSTQGFWEKSRVFRLFRFRRCVQWPRRARRRRRRRFPETRTPPTKTRKRLRSGKKHGPKRETLQVDVRSYRAVPALDDPGRGIV